MERNAAFALLGFVGVVVMAGASGCGSSSASGGADAGKKKDSGVPVIGDDDDDDDSGQDGGLGDDDDGGDASLLGPSYGSVALAETASSAGAYSYTLTVGFASTASGGTGCTTKTLTPACVLTSCPASTSAPSPLSAGVVTVRDGTGGPTATATPSGSSYPTPAPVTGQPFQPGDLLSAAAAGASGGIAAFTAQAIAPDDIQVTAPSLTRLSFPRSQPLSVAWGNGLAGTDTAGDSTKVQVVVATTSTSAVKTITCSFSAAELSGSVPLSGADGTDYVDQAGTGGVTGTISLTPTSTTEAVAGTRAVTFVVTATGASGSFTTTD